MRRKMIKLHSTLNNVIAIVVKVKDSIGNTLGSKIEAMPLDMVRTIVEHLPKQ